jgi:hypothetical protein
MIFTQSLPFINEFVEQLDQGIRECTPHHPLPTAQRYWLRLTTYRFSKSLESLTA